MAAMTYEEMERALAEATLSSFAHTPVVKSVTVPAVKSHDAMLSSQSSGLSHLTSSRWKSRSRSCKRECLS